jgi:hypothetical protein
MLDGFRSFGYDCSNQGCFNVKHRLRFGMFYDALPGRNSFSDLDAVTEICGNLLMLELKSKKGIIPTGQHLLFMNASVSKQVTALCLVGCMEPLGITHMKKYFHGRCTEWLPSSADHTYATIERWSAWARANPVA